MTLSELVNAEWKPNAALNLKKSSMRHYSFNLGKHILPAFGELPPARHWSRADRILFVEAKTKGARDVDATQCAGHVCHGPSIGPGTWLPLEEPCSWSPDSRNGLEKRASVLLAGANPLAAGRAD
jgi:hypothetical protein